MQWRAPMVQCVLCWGGLPSYGGTTSVHPLIVDGNLGYFPDSGYILKEELKEFADG